MSGEDLIEESREMIAQAAPRGGRVCPGLVMDLLLDAGSDHQGPANIGKFHLVRVVPGHVLQITGRDGQHGFGHFVLAVAKRLGAGDGIQGIRALHGNLGFRVLGRAVGGASFDAAPPVKITGPALDRAQGGPDLPGRSGIAALGTQFQVGTEGFEGAVRFAGGLGERQRRGGCRRSGGMEWRRLFDNF